MWSWVSLAKKNGVSIWRAVLLRDNLPELSVQSGSVLWRTGSHQGHSHFWIRRRWTRPSIHLPPLFCQRTVWASSAGLRHGGFSSSADFLACKSSSPLTCLSFSLSRSAPLDPLISTLALPLIFSIHIFVCYCLPHTQPQCHSTLHFDPFPPYATPNLIVSFWSFSPVLCPPVCFNEQPNLYD